jgi:uncharacterized short protein YbdD (DUF466 family)
MKTDEQFFKDRLDMCESGGWKDLMEELETFALDAQDVESLKGIEDLWYAKGKLATLNLMLGLEEATKYIMEQSSAQH